MTRKPDPDRLAGLILAGGRSARMGRDKALIEWRGATLLDRARTLLRAAGTDVIHVGGRPDEPDGLADHDPGAGPARAILDAARLLRGRYGRLLVIPVDMPLLSPAELEPLLAARRGEALHWLGQPLPALIPVQACAALTDEDVRSVRYLLTALRAEAVAMPSLPDGKPDPFSNINTPQALAGLESTADDARQAAGISLGKIAVRED